jgi:hypothetical protein
MAIMRIPFPAMVFWNAGGCLTKIRLTEPLLYTPRVLRLTNPPRWFVCAFATESWSERLMVMQTYIYIYT